MQAPNTNYYKVTLTITQYSLIGW